MGALWELIAFIFRALQTRHQSNDVYDQYYMIFFLLAPICKYHSGGDGMKKVALTNMDLGINAFVYMTMGRMINFFIPEKRFWGISAHRFGTIFVCLDIFAFLIQLAGASMTSIDGDGQNLVQIGLHIYMGGIGAQEAFVLCFTALTIHLHVRLVKMENTDQIPEKLSQGAFPWQWLFYSIYLALAMITVSCVRNMHLSGTLGFYLFPHQ